MCLPYRGSRTLEDHEETTGRSYIRRALNYFVGTLLEDTSEVSGLIRDDNFLSIKSKHSRV